MAVLKISKKKKSTFRILILLLILFLVLFLTGSAWLMRNVFHEKYGALPDTSELRNIQNSQATEIYTADSVLMGRYYFVNRNAMEYDQIPEEIIHALIATEDARFFEHHGIDVRSLFRVLFKTILLGDRSAGGGSTLTQQLAKNLYPRKGEGIIAIIGTKLREMIIAYRIENLYSKNMILQLYLNTVPFGENTYGIRNAAQLYFNREPDRLTINQASTLIGTLKATSTYNPHAFPEQSIERRNVVLHQLQKYQYISESTYDSLIHLPLNTNYSPIGQNEGLAPYFREHLRPIMENWCKEHKKPNGESYDLYTDGLKIYTSIQSNLQKSALDAIKKHIPKLQNQLDKELESSPNQDKIKTLARKIIRKRFGQKIEHTEEPHTAVHKKKPMEVFSWEGPKTVQMSVMDSVEYYLKFLHAGFIAIDPDNGNILAWIGGIDHQFFKYDHVRSKRQMGSVFKPFVYANALESGVKPCDFYPNDSIVYEEFDNWTPSNADRTYGGVYSVQGALVNSVNTVSVQLLMEAGIPNTIKRARMMGFKDSLPEVPSLALGTASSSVLNLAEAYTTFSNTGTFQPARKLLRIENSEGEVLEKFTSPEKQKNVLSSATSEEINMMLQNVIQRGTAQSLKKFPYADRMAGKTGTTQNHSDGWFVAYSPDIVTACWVGADYPEVHFQSIQYGQGAATALPVTGYFLQNLSQNKQNKHHFPSFQYKEIDTTSFKCADYREKAPGLLEKLFNIQLFKSKKDKRDSNDTTEGREKEKKKGFFKRLFNKIKGDKDHTKKDSTQQE